MADLDLDAIATARDISRAERDALVAVARWAQDAPHHDGCPAATTGLIPHPPCTCGRDEVLGR